MRKKWNNELLGEKIVKPSMEAFSNADFVLIASSCVNEIKGSLKAINVPGSKILVWPG